MMGLSRAQRYVLIPSDMAFDSTVLRGDKVVIQVY